MTVDEITKGALALDFKTRARLAETLLVSIEAPSSEEVTTLWVEEARHRSNAIATGKSTTISSEELFARLDAKYA
jgi:putative addiction module component (TIGR02574 family)